MSARIRQYSDMDIDYEDLERQYEILRRSPRHAEVMKNPDIVDRSMPPVRTTIQDLPLEILHNVLGRLDSRSLFCFTETCKGFCDVGRQLHKWFNTTYVQPNLPSFVFFKRLSNDPAYRGQVEHITFDTWLLGPPCPGWNEDPSRRTEHFNRWRRSRDALGLSLPPELEDLALDLLGLDKLEALYDGHCDYFRGQEFTRRNMANMFPSDILASFTSLRSLLYSADTKWPGEDDNPVATSLLGLSQFPDRDLLFYFLIDSCKRSPSPRLTGLKFWQMSVATWNMMEQVLPGHPLISNAFSNITNLRRVDLQFRQPESRAEPRELGGAFNATLPLAHLVNLEELQILFDSGARSNVSLSSIIGPTQHWEKLESLTLLNIEVHSLHISGLTRHAATLKSLKLWDISLFVPRYLGVYESPTCPGFQDLLEGEMDLEVCEVEIFDLSEDD